MFFAKLLLFVALCFTYSAGAPRAQEQVKVTLYFEGLCPGCHELISNSLYSGYKQLGDNLLFDFVPLGWSESQEVGGKLEWTCQHGPLECYINKINACAINLNSTQSQLVEFIHCHIVKSVASNSNEQQLEFAMRCAADNNLSYDDINSCVSSDVVNTLLLGYAARQDSLDPEMPYVPYLLFNDVFNESDEDDATVDFAKVACKYFKEKPAACSNLSDEIKPAYVEKC